MAIFPIRQDRIALWILLTAAFIGIPLLDAFQVWPFGGEYLLRAILIPFLILSLAAVGLNILTGYCGQVSLGTGGFMAVGAYAAYNLALRLPEPNIFIVFLFGGAMALPVGLPFGLPSRRIKGF